MARIRSIKPEFWTDEKVVSLSPLARLLFIGMWNFVDDFGRAEHSPARLKMQILPADSADISELLGEIRREKLIVVYAVDGKEYFEVCGFTKHQKVDHRSPSKIPPPSSSSAESPRILAPDQGKDQGKEREDNTAPASKPNGRVYAFEHGVVRLTASDLEKWQKAFPHVAVEAELMAKEPWLAKQPKWFHAAAGWLAKAERQATSRGPPDDDEPPIRDPSEGF